MSDQRSSLTPPEYTDAEARGVLNQLRNLLESAHVQTNRLCRYAYDDSQPVGLYLRACSTRDAVDAAIRHVHSLTEQFNDAQRAKP
jgi:hypothetical protein